MFNRLWDRLRRKQARNPTSTSLAELPVVAAPRGSIPANNSVAPLESSGSSWQLFDDGPAGTRSVADLVRGVRRDSLLKWAARRRSSTLRTVDTSAAKQEALARKAFMAWVSSIQRIYSKHEKNPAKLERAMTKAIASLMSDLMSLPLSSASTTTLAMELTKVAYLYTLGYDSYWAAQCILSLMQTSTFGHKRVAYWVATTLNPIAAPLTTVASLDAIDPVTLVATASRSVLPSQSDKDRIFEAIAFLLRKDFAGGNPFEVGLALTTVASLASTYLAKQLSPYVAVALRSHDPGVRSKAVATSWALHRAAPVESASLMIKVQDALTDEDPKVQAVALNVITELIHANPEPYRSLAPLLLEALDTTESNWVIMKLLKSFATLMEPLPSLGGVGSLDDLPPSVRPTANLIPPLAQILEACDVPAVLCDAIDTACTLRLTEVAAISSLIADKVKTLVLSPDANLAILGMKAGLAYMKATGSEGSDSLAWDTFERVHAQVNSDTPWQILAPAVNFLVGITATPTAIRVVIAISDLLDGTDSQVILGLHALTMLAPVVPEPVSYAMDCVIPKLDDPEKSIRLAAVNLMIALVSSPSDLEETIGRLMQYHRRPGSDPELIYAMIRVCQSDNYQNLPEDPTWYRSVLLELVMAPGTDHVDSCQQELDALEARSGGATQMDPGSLTPFQGGGLTSQSSLELEIHPDALENMSNRPNSMGSIPLHPEDDPDFIEEQSTSSPELEDRSSAVPTPPPPLSPTTINPALRPESVGITNSPIPSPVTGVGSLFMAATPGSARSIRSVRSIRSIRSSRSLRSGRSTRSLRSGGSARRRRRTIGSMRGSPSPLPHSAGDDDGGSSSSSAEELMPPMGSLRRLPPRMSINGGSLSRRASSASPSTTSVRFDDGVAEGRTSPVVMVASIAARKGIHPGGMTSESEQELPFKPRRPPSGRRASMMSSASRTSMASGRSDNPSAYKELQDPDSPSTATAPLAPEPAPVDAGDASDSSALSNSGVPSYATMKPATSLNRIRSTRSISSSTSATSTSADSMEPAVPIPDAIADAAGLSDMASVSSAASADSSIAEAAAGALASRKSLSTSSSTESVGEFLSSSETAPGMGSRSGAESSNSDTDGETDYYTQWEDQEGEELPETITIATPPQGTEPLGSFAARVKSKGRGIPSAWGSDTSVTSPESPYDIPTSPVARTA